MYLRGVDDGARAALGTPVSEMGDDIRLAAIKALVKGDYTRHASSDECGGFVSEIEEWEGSDDGRLWHEQYGEQVAGAVLAFHGLDDCKDLIEYNYFKAEAGDVRVAGGGVHVLGETLSRDGDFAYSATRELRLDQTLVHQGHFGTLQWTVECSIRADVDARERTVSNPEVGGAEFMQDGCTLSKFLR